MDFSVTRLSITVRSLVWKKNNLIKYKQIYQHTQKNADHLATLINATTLSPDDFRGSCSQKEIYPVDRNLTQSRQSRIFLACKNFNSYNSFIFVLLQHAATCSTYWREGMQSGHPVTTHELYITEAQTLLIVLQIPFWMCHVFVHKSVHWFHHFWATPLIMSCSGKTCHRFPPSKTELREEKVSEWRELSFILQTITPTVAAFLAPPPLTGNFH